MSRPSPLSEDELRTAIKNSLVSGTFFYAKPHMTQRLKERGLSMEDVYHVCETGRLKRNPVWENGRWKYRLDGLDLESEETSVIVAVSNECDWVMAVTIF